MLKLININDCIKIRLFILVIILLFKKLFCDSKIFIDCMFDIIIVYFVIMIIG